MKIGFYVLGQKAYVVLKSFISEFGADNISYIVVGKDSNVQNDYYNKIVDLSNKHKIKWIDRNNLDAMELNYEYYAFAIGWRWIIKNNNKLIVLHDSLLPKYRGFSPLVNMLLNSERQIGVTALFASEDYDKGDIIEQVSINVDYPIRIQDAIDKISDLYSVLALSVSRKILISNKVDSTEQCESEATYSVWRDEDDYHIDWKSSSDYIERFVDSVSYPYSCAYTIYDDRKIRVNKVKQIPDVYIHNRANNIGKCIFMKEGKPVIVCGSGLILLESCFLDTHEHEEYNDFRFRVRLK